MFLGSLLHGKFKNLSRGEHFVRRFQLALLSLVFFLGSASEIERVTIASIGFSFSWSLFSRTIDSSVWKFTLFLSLFLFELVGCEELEELEEDEPPAVVEDSENERKKFEFA